MISEFPYIPVLDAADLRIRAFHGLKGNHPRLDASGLILIEGDQQIERLLRGATRIRTLFMEPRFYTRFAPLLELRAIRNGEQFPECYGAERDVMQQILGYRLHQGVMALADRPRGFRAEDLDLPVAALNGLNDPENVGAIVRTCAAFGIRSMLVDAPSADPLLRRAIRVSMGAALEMNIARTELLAPALSVLRKRARIVAVETAPQSLPMESYVFRRETVLVFGNERNGIDETVLETCQDVLQIGMERSVVGSLNVAAAAAIACEALYRSLSSELRSVVCV